MSSSSIALQKAVPAQLNFFAIYNPSLGDVDENLENQILYYSSPETREEYRQRRRPRKSSAAGSQEEKNERLRQIGLAQGMVEFAGSFSNGKAVDTIDTEHSRIILHELEAGWWLLTSINLTKLPTKIRDTSFNPNPDEDQLVEYSSREVKPPALLLQDLLRAQSTFLLHHAPSMNELFARTKRSTFVKILGRYWDRYLSTWNVMLHGNPVVNVYGGIKLAASGELGVGVGEEDRGSGEREVLEGFIGRIDGLVDLVVSRFGDAEQEVETGKSLKSLSQPGTISSKQWLGTGAEPTQENGAIFLGVGALSRKSLCDVTHWMEDIYSWGSGAYGVEESPILTRKSKRKSKVGETPQDIDPCIKSQKNTPTGTADPKGAGADMKGPVESQSPISSISSEGIVGHKKAREIQSASQREHTSQQSGHSAPSREGIARYFKFGYGSYWTLGPITSGQIDKSTERETQISSQTTNRASGKTTRSRVETANTKVNSSTYSLDDSAGLFLIGPVGERLCETNHTSAMNHDGEEANCADFRIEIRTVTVELEQGDARKEKGNGINVVDEVCFRHDESEGSTTPCKSFESKDCKNSKELRVVVYVHRPFVFVFLFELETASLAMLSLYRSLRQQLMPLQRPLLSSTKYCLLRPEVSISTAGSKPINTPIYDFIWDSKLWTITSTIPNIPEPTHSGEQLTSSAPWTRIEALNTHMQLLSTFAETRNDRLQIERTCKTSRGWWVVWTYIPDSDIGSSTATPNAAASPEHGPGTPLLKPEESIPIQRPLNDMSLTDLAASQSMDTDQGHSFFSGENVLPAEPKGKEIILIRRACEYAERTPSRFLSTNPVTGETGPDSGITHLAQGIGVDTKRYIEELLNMD